MLADSAQVLYGKSSTLGTLLRQMGTVGHPSTGLVGSFCVDNEEGNGPKHGFYSAQWCGI